MSGSSLNYMYHSDLVPRLWAVQDAEQHLRAAGHIRAADRTKEVVDMMLKIEVIQKEMAEIWHDVEWVLSGDYGPEDLAETVKKWEQWVKAVQFQATYSTPLPTTLEEIAAALQEGSAIITDRTISYEGAENVLVSEPFEDVFDNLRSREPGREVTVFDEVSDEKLNALVGAPNKFFEFIAACAALLKMPKAYGEELLKDRCWFFCFDDGLTPEQAVEKYKQSEEYASKEWPK